MDSIKTEIKKLFIDVIDNIKRGNGISQNDIAKSIGISAQNLSNIIRHNRGVPEIVIMKISEVYNIDINTFNPLHKKESSIQSNTQTQKPNNIMQQNSDYKDVAMKSMAQRIQELENKVIELTKNSIEDELKPKSREVG